MGTSDDFWKLPRWILLSSRNRLHDPRVIRTQIYKNMGYASLKQR